jgi:lysophospholipase L1-like esterase
MKPRGINARKRLAATLAPLALAACVAAAADHPFALKDGETVVFYGDSITAQRFYTAEVEEFVLTRYPRLHVRFVNAGVPGDTAAGGYAGAMAERVARDVRPYEPGMVTVLLGMNDGGWGYGSPDRIDADFRTRYDALLHAIRQAAPGTELTLISSTPYDEITHGTEFSGYSKMIDRLAGDVTSIAAQMQSPDGTPVLLADFHHPMSDALERAKARDPQLAPLLIPDRIHPAETSHWIMAASLMTTWGVDPVVSSVELRAADATIFASHRTAITEIEKSSDGLEWTQRDEALPLPLDFNNAMTTLLLQVSNIGELDRQILRVDGLAPGRYELRIDGKPVAVFTRDELQRGVNLALYKTPMLEQARAIAVKEDQRADLDRARFILSADTKPIATSGIAAATLRAAQNELDADLRKSLSPRPHRFELRHAQDTEATNAARAR